MPQNADAAQHWTNRAPWAVFTLTPVALLAAAYLAACLILWSGWKIFLPQTSTPFVRVYGAAVLYFGVGRALYYSAPLVIGWGVALLAAKRQIEATWPAIGLVSTALMAAAAQVYADQPIPGHGGSIGINLALSNPGTLTRAFILFAITALPYLIWRIKGRPVNHPPAV